VAAFCLGRGEDSFFEIQQELVQEIKIRREYYIQTGILSENKIEDAIWRTKGSSGSFCPKTQWMVFPYAGELMANAYETPVILYSNEMPITFFPHFCPPNNNKPIIFGHIAGIHHVYALRLKSNHHFPRPQASYFWMKNASKEARKWEHMYPN
jgi:hypothetical protein